jgi:hypothetical protein
MKTERLKDVSPRYRKVGGLPSAIERYERGEVTLADIGAAIGYSRETVRKDFKGHLGDGQFRQLVEQRGEAQREKRGPVWMDVASAREHLARKAREADGAAKGEARVLSQVLAEAEAADVPLSMILTSQGSVSYALPDGPCVQIRVAVVDGRLKEHRIGFHRFKITPAVTRCPFVVFGLNVGDKTLCFVFKSSDIAGVRSLNLRFEAESKYDITRKSKYDRARDKWSILKSRVR